MHTGAGVVEARRVLLCAGMIDVLPDLPGYPELWGKSLFQCPYCHGWEVRERAFGFIAPSAESLEWSMFLKGWTSDVAVFTGGAFAVPEETRARLARARIPIEERGIVGLGVRDGRLEGVLLEGGARVARDVLFVRPPQRQVPLVDSLGLALDDQGFVRVDHSGQSSVPGIYAAGDLTTMQQGAVMAAAAGARAAAMLNHELTMALVAAGAL